MKNLILLTSFIASSAFAGSGSSKPVLTLPTYVPGTCIVDANDPFEPNVKMLAGPQKGWCVNPLKRRSVKTLSMSEAAPYFPQKDGTWVIANFSHQNKFWIAQIPFKKVKSLRMQVEYFPILKFPKIDIAHTQFVFDFSDGEQILLMPQVRNVPAGTQPIRLNKMIFSVENVGPYGEMFDAEKGMEGYYNVAYRAVSLADKYQWMIAEQGHKVIQIPLKLDPMQVRDVLTESLIRGSGWSTRRTYNTFEPNCVSELFHILDSSLKIYDFDLPWLPNNAKDSLEERGLVDTSIKLPTLNEEYKGVP